LPIPTIYGRTLHRHVLLEHSMDSAKVFMTGRSQAVRLPKAYRFDTAEVLIERLADGAVVLRAKPQGPLGDRLWAILDELPDDPSFVRPDQGAPEVRDWPDEPALGPTARSKRPAQPKR
jgi:antitoxin VapB